MSKKIIECPHCGGQRLTFNEKFSILRYYTIDDNKLYKTGDSHPSLARKEEIWFRCIECSQKEEFEVDGGEWKATPEQAKVIRDMMMEHHRADITEHMSREIKEYNGL